MDRIFSADWVLKRNFMAHNSTATVREFHLFCSRPKFARLCQPGSFSAFLFSPYNTALAPPRSNRRFFGAYISVPSSVCFLSYRNTSFFVPFCFPILNSFEKLPRVSLTRSLTLQGRALNHSGALDLPIFPSKTNPMLRFYGDFYPLPFSPLLFCLSFLILFFLSNGGFLRDSYSFLCRLRFPPPGQSGLFSSIAPPPYSSKRLPLTVLPSHPTKHPQKPPHPPPQPPTPTHPTPPPPPNHNHTPPPHPPPTPPTMFNVNPSSVLFFHGGSSRLLFY